MSALDPVATIPGSSHTAPVETARGDAFRERYALGEPLGEGGMGVVRACRDQRIGREVAMKTTRAEHLGRADIILRFAREACVQGQLEHPAIVPVYDLGRDPDGNFYFTMKRVRGATFEQIVRALRARDAGAMRRFSRRKLLVAFASVCQALEFAHARGVIHRDLKPGNIMLGDYGEVYVLDWGLVKLPDAPDPSQDSAADAGSTPPTRAQTQRGTAMGTPGYMAPEQVRGEDVDARTDVYALGAILFELLALEPLHRPALPEAMHAATAAGADARASVRAPHLDIPPELDAVCVRATAVSPGDRLESVHELVNAVERYLDGDRDLQRRREMALEYARSAAALAERALSGGDGATPARSLALQEVGKALTFDPTNTEALATLVHLLTVPPRELPADARAEIARARARNLATGGRAAGHTFIRWFLFAWFGFLPVSVWAGIKSWSATLVAGVAWLAAAAVSLLAAQCPEAGGRLALPILLLGALAIACTASFFGPFFFLPGFIVIYGMMFTLVSPDQSKRWVVVGICLLAVVGPAALGRAGLLPQVYEFHEDAIVIHAGMLHFLPAPTVVFLLLTSVAMVMTTCSMTAIFRDALTSAEERLQVQSWQLRQMLPPEARLSVPPAAARR
jgi:serine/threonine-protein kinase